MRKILVVAVSLVTFLSSAQPDEEVIKHIPSNSAFVISYNFGNMMEKIDIEIIKSLPVMQDGFAEMKRSAREDSAIVKNLWKSPKKYGLTAEPAVAMYFQFKEGKYSPEANFGILASLKSSKKFEKLIKHFLKEEYEDFVEEKNGYKYYYKREFGLAWNKKTMFILGGNKLSTEDIIAEQERIMTLDPSNSMLSNQEFQQYLKKKNDISLFFQPGEMFKVMEKEFENEDFNPFKLMDFGNMTSSYELNFNDGAIESIWTQQPDEKMQRFWESMKEERLDPSMMKYLTSDVMAHVSWTSDIEKIKNFYVQEYPELTDSLTSVFYKSVAKSRVEKDSLVEDVQWSDTLSWEEWSEISDANDAVKDSLIEVYQSDSERHVDSVLTEYSLKKDDVWKLLAGDMLMTLNGSYEVIDTFQTYDFGEDEDGEMGYIEVEKTKRVKMPLFRGFMLTKAPQLAQRILDSLVTHDMITPEGEYYKLVYTEQEYFFALNKENVFLVTNDGAFVPKFMNGDITPDKNARIQKLIAETTGSMYIDMQAVMNTFVPEEMNEAKEVVANYIDHIEMKTWMDQTSNAKMTFALTTSQNAIYSIFELINSMYLKYGKRN